MNSRIVLPVVAQRQHFVPRSDALAMVGRGELDMAKS